MKNLLKMSKQCINLRMKMLNFSKTQKPTQRAETLFSCWLSLTLSFSLASAKNVTTYLLKKQPDKVINVLPLNMKIPYILLLIYNVDEYKWLFELYVKVISVIGIYFTNLLWLVFYIIGKLYIFSFGFSCFTFITNWIALIVRYVSVHKCRVFVFIRVSL